MLAPIVVFCYNRPAHLAQTLEALRQNPLAEQSPLIIFSDGARSSAEAGLVAEVRNVINALTGFHSIQIHESSVNQGLAQSVIAGVSEVLRQYGRIIVLEDDMLCTTDFLDYINRALDTYESRADIFSVTAYTPPVDFPENYPHDVFLAPRASSWGWGTWQNKWEKADWTVSDFEQIKQDIAFQKRLIQGGEDLWPMLVKQQRGVIDSWAIRWIVTQARHLAYGVYPVRSKIKNIGTDGSGTNFIYSTTSYGQELAEGPVRFPAELLPEAEMMRRFEEYYRLPWKLKLKNRLKYGV
ncbi:glycosyltransferase [Arundinibacter roseus]|uniref:Glycosyltransferase n=1 Tax=Arundinibacter roseus TaxID=2070510 RepID=A0A4R4K4G1_9BACT|nr:glycosyltransferase [Arundinibacter roseus]TDB61376.1 glycosyltransferase [Arundinibacter roseus]